MDIFSCIKISFGAKSWHDFLMLDLFIIGFCLDFPDYLSASVIVSLPLAIDTGVKSHYRGMKFHSRLKAITGQNMKIGAGERVLFFFRQMCLIPGNG